MTIVVALKYKDGVTVATDTRETFGEIPLMRESKNKRIEQLGSNIAVATVGLTGESDKLVEFLKESFNRIPSESNILPDVVAKCEDFLWNFYKRYKERFEDEEEEFTVAILATKDKIFLVDERGYREEENYYACEGSGKLYGEYILKQSYQDSMDEISAKKLAASIIYEVSRIDPNVGLPIRVAILNDQGFRIFGQEEAIPSVFIQKKTRDEINNLVVEIVEKRRWINDFFNTKYGFKPFKQDEIALCRMQKDCLTEEDFTDAISWLALLTDKMDMKEFKDRNTPTIGALENFLKQNYPKTNYLDIISNMRDIMTLRSKKKPIHEDDPKLIQVLLKWGHKIPPNWSEVWIEALCRYRDSLKLLGEITQI